MPGEGITILGDLSKPAVTLIEKISEALGGAFRPFQIRRVANAEADAAIMKANADIVVEDIHRRAVTRWFNEEARKQSNMEAIAEKAIPLLSEAAEPQEVDSDWIANYFEKCRIVSDKSMQLLWAKILAGEANAPGSFTRRTINLLGDLERTDAMQFSSICSFGWTIDSKVVPLGIDTDDTFFSTRGVTFEALAHLESLGLVRFDPMNPFVLGGLEQQCSADYFGRTLSLAFPEKGGTLDVGVALLTKPGEELARVCGAAPIEEYFELMQDKWKKRGLL